MTCFYLPLPFQFVSCHSDLTFGFPFSLAKFHTVGIIVGGPLGIALVAPQWKGPWAVNFGSQAPREPPEPFFATPKAGTPWTSRTQGSTPHIFGRVLNRWVSHLCPPIPRKRVPKGRCLGPQVLHILEPWAPTTGGQPLGGPLTSTVGHISLSHRGLKTSPKNHHGGPTNSLFHGAAGAV